MYSITPGITRKLLFVCVPYARVYTPDRCSSLGKTKVYSRFANHPNLIKKRSDFVFYSKPLKQQKVNFKHFKLKMVDLETGGP